MRRPGVVPVSFGSPRSRTITAGTFLVTDAHFDGETHLPRHHHDRPIVAVTMTGVWNSVIASRRFDLTRGDLHTEPAGEAHSNNFGAPGAHVVVIQPDPDDDRLRSCGSLLDAPRQITMAASLSLARRITTEFDLHDNLSLLAIESAVLELIAAASRGTRAGAVSERWLKEVVDYMHAHFLEAPSVDALAQVAGVHPAHFAREFRRRYHLSPASYLRRLRVDWTAEQLRETDRPLADISGAGGFSDQSHFTRTFGRFVGVTPSAYRRDHLWRRRRKQRGAPA